MLLPEKEDLRSHNVYSVNMTPPMLKILTLKFSQRMTIFYNCKIKVHFKMPQPGGCLLTCISNSLKWVILKMTVIKLFKYDFEQVIITYNLAVQIKFVQYFEIITYAQLLPVEVVTCVSSIQ